MRIEESWEPWVKEFERTCYELDKGMRRMYVYKTGFSEGEASGKEETIEQHVLRCFSKGKSVEEIADFFDVPLADVERCLEKNRKEFGRI